MPTDRDIEEAQESRLLVSDPTSRTSRTILREVEVLEKLTKQRMDAIEKAVEVAHEDRVRFPTEVQKAIDGVEKLFEAKLAIHLQKFDGIEKQFKERDTRIEQTAKDAKTAIDAALLAAEKAVGRQEENNNKATAKSDLSFWKQIDQQGALMGAMKSELDSRITDVKDRFTAFQATNQGRSEEKIDRRDSTSLWVAIGGLVLGIVLGALGIIIAK